MTLPRRLAVAAATVLLALTGGAAMAAAAGWHSEQPLTAGSSVPVSLGAVYDMEFWAPNRGVLITADGLWAYDGTGWHRLATVCGGTGGRIAWAGPLDFWTISDQPAGQSNPTGASLAVRSLCHFVNGAIVASYAQPLGQTGSYQAMHGAACLAADDCWFAGDRLPGTVNTGAFHLQWNGSLITPWPSLTTRDPTLTDPGRTISDLAVFQGRLFEAVRVADDDVANEASDNPFVLHEIVSGESPAFSPQFTDPPIHYGNVAPSRLGGFQLSADGSALWLAAGPGGSSDPPAPPQILRYGVAGLQPVPLDDPQGLLTHGSTISDLAAEPGTDSAWVAYTPPSDQGGTLPAHLARVRADGSIDDVSVLPSEADGIARKQQADHVACPAAGQCWLSTRAGWLFHLGDSLPRDDAPEMHGLITFRPPDASTVVFSPDTLPDDDSGIAPPVFDEPPPIPYMPPVVPPKTKAKKLVAGLRHATVKGTKLTLRFTLTAKARVQLVALRKKTVVAKTKLRTLAKGKHSLTLKLNRKHWPTKLDLRAKLYTAKAKAPATEDDVSSDDNPDAGPVTIAGVPRGAR